MRSLDAPAHQLARGRSSYRAAVCALVVTLAVPGAASAATGDTALRFARAVAMKLGSSASCYHQPCDTAGKLDRVALGRHVRVVGRALAAR